MEDEGKLMTPKKLADYLDLGEQTVYRMVKRGEIPVVIRIGRTIRFRKTDVDRWLSSKMGGERRAPPGKKRGKRR